MTSQTSSSIDTTNHKLINFNVPQYLIKNFDNLVRFKRVSRTSMLISLMETYIREENQRIIDDRSLNRLITDIEEKNQRSLTKELRQTVEAVKEEYEPPMIPMTSDEEEWSSPLSEMERWRKEMWG